jgi:hypothetical protein
LSRPAELALDLLDELADLGGSSFGLFALDTETTATNNPTYFVNNRRRVFGTGASLEAGSSCPPANADRRFKLRKR